MSLLITILLSFSAAHADGSMGVDKIEGKTAKKLYQLFSERLPAACTPAECSVEVSVNCTETVGMHLCTLGRVGTLDLVQFMGIDARRIIRTLAEVGVQPICESIACVSIVQNMRCANFGKKYFCEMH